ncbi:MAG: segregation/condensation protein A [Candidatus Harrisonbacteria bacterium]|nr:segregation/condensation protein A [Candidatus Harrisonbacteria bacterium]
MNRYEVKTGQFTGPLDKLLQLIEGKHLEITQVNLAEVTADFLNYIKKLGEQYSPSILADFLVVAAKLVLIKSKVLLPMLELTKEEETEIHDLEERLKIYKEFKIAGEHLKNLWDKNRISYGRPLLLSLGDAAVFYPPPGLKVSDLSQAVRGLAAALQALIPEQQKIKTAVISIEQKIEELLNRFKESGSHSFQTLSQKKSRTEAIVLFLAVLHLLKDKIIHVEQKESFSDILIHKH